jgi:hypothetical protein
VPGEFQADARAYSPDRADCGCTAKHGLARGHGARPRWAMLVRRLQNGSARLMGKPILVAQRRRRRLWCQSQPSKRGDAVRRWWADHAWVVLARKDYQCPSARKTWLRLDILHVPASRNAQGKRRASM